MVGRLGGGLGQQSWDLAQSSRVGEAGPSMKALGPEEGGAGHNGKVAPTQV